MRFTTCLLAALLASSSILAPRIADACGGSYETIRRAPQVMLLSSHTVFGMKDGDGRATTRRAFAITRTNFDVAADAAWERIAPRSYDYTDILSLDKPETAMSFTLLGTSGTRVVRSDSRVALRHDMFISGSQLEGFELALDDKDEFEIVLAGRHGDAVWHDTVRTYSMASPIAGTNLTATRSYVDGKPMVQISVGGEDRGTFEGYIAGAVDVGGSRYVVMKTTFGTAYTLEVTK